MCSASTCGRSKTGQRDLGGRGRPNRNCGPFVMLVLGRNECLDSRRGDGPAVGRHALVVTRLPRALVILIALAAGLHATIALGDATQELRQAVERDYSYRDLRHVDWSEQFSQFTPRLRAASSTAEFAKLASDLLARAEDIHITVQAGESVLQPFQRNTAPNYEMAIIPKLVPDVRSDHRCVSFGHAGEGIGYLVIGQWTTPCEASAESALDALMDQRAIIIDVRPNSGGDDMLASQFAGRFIEKPAVYAYVETLANGHFQARRPRTLLPNLVQRHFRGKVYVLIGPRCMSSNESFLLMMRSATAVLVGTRSYGSSGNPKEHRLSNGVIVKLPSWREYEPSGALLEGKGVDPDVRVQWPQPAAADPVLGAALDLLRPKK